MVPASDSESVNNEIRLVAQTGAGDRAAFRELYHRYSGPLLALATRMIGDVGAAEDLLQDAFVKIWRGAAYYDSRKSRPFTWAVTIVRRTCIDHLRRHRLRTVEATRDLAMEVALQPEPVDSPRQATALREDAERVHLALTQMPKPQRAALELALFSGYTHAEIAAQLGEPVGTVKSWIRRGLLELRSHLNRSAP